MKKAIELLAQLTADIKELADDRCVVMDFSPWFELIHQITEEIRPRWETPEQYEKRTGEKWPDNGAVYYQYILNGAARDKWRTGNYKNISDSDADFRSHNAGHHQIICATEAGPPPDDWKPEEEKGE